MAHVVMVYVSVLLIQQLAYDKNTVYWLTAVVMALGALSTPLFGAWSDRVGRRTLMIGAAAGTIVLFIPLFYVLTTATNLILTGVVFVGLVVLGQSFSPGYTVFVESFPHPDPVHKGAPHAARYARRVVTQLPSRPPHAEARSAEVVSQLVS
ncbi:MFS transporter [Pseudonocardia sp. NPDC049154]|uniref:MFS transporter n=1 Tax=Pseudonocardia sp. NPDC049154 TaxID=3155501 RepID=UPI003410A180